MKGEKPKAKLILLLLSITDQCNVIVRVSLGLIIGNTTIALNQNYLF